MVQCRLCSHYCLINDGGYGLCRARMNMDGELRSLVYGRCVAMNVDPVEKKPLYHFCPGSNTFSFGTLGCNFHCKNCHNYQISQAEADNNTSFTSPKEIVEMALNAGCSSISYTYNEPTVFFEYALETMKLAKEKDLANIWVSNGYMSPQALKAIVPYLDAVNIDLKSMDDDFYRRVCRGRVKPVLNNLQRLKRSGVHIEISTLVVPTLSDNKENLKKIAKFIAKKIGKRTPWHISRFSPEISWKLKELPPTNEWKMETAYKAGRNAGLEFVYFPFGQENTYCQKCGELGVKRFYFDSQRFDREGKCANCGYDLNIN